MNLIVLSLIIVSASGKMYPRFERINRIIELSYKLKGPESKYQILTSQNSRQKKRNQEHVKYDDIKKKYSNALDDDEDSNSLENEEIKYKGLYF